MPKTPLENIIKNTATTTYMIEAEKEQFQKFKQATDLKIIDSTTKKVLTFRNINHYNTERKIQ